MQEHKMVHEWHRAITLPPNKYHDPCWQKPEPYIPHNNQGGDNMATQNQQNWGKPNICLAADKNSCY